MKKKLKKCICVFVRQLIHAKKRWNLLKVDRRICSLHKEWNDLDEKELKVIRGNKYAYKAFKNMHGGSLENYVSDGLYQTQVLPRLNAANYSKAGSYHGRTYFADKNYIETFVKDIKTLDCVIRNVNGVFYTHDFKQISSEKALSYMKEYPKLVCKRTIETGHGKDVAVIEHTGYEALINGNENDYVVQKILKQHESLAYYNESSVNVIRITTLFWKGEIFILGGVLRVGAPGAFCDHVAEDGIHPLVIAIQENGMLGNKAFDCDDGYVYDNVHGKAIKGSIFKYEEMKELVKKEHMKYPNHGIIGWDLTLDEAGDIRCIEYNVRCPGVIQSQYVLGPIFEQKMKSEKTLLDEILNVPM